MSTNTAPAQPTTWPDAQHMLSLARMKAGVFMPQVDYVRAGRLADRAQSKELFRVEGGFLIVPGQEMPISDALKLGDQFGVQLTEVRLAAGRDRPQRRFLDDRLSRRGQERLDARKQQDAVKSPTDTTIPTIVPEKPSAEAKAKPKSSAQGSLFTIADAAFLMPGSAPEAATAEQKHAD